MCAPLARRADQLLAERRRIDNLVLVGRFQVDFDGVVALVEQQRQRDQALADHLCGVRAAHASRDGCEPRSRREETCARGESETERRRHNISHTPMGAPAPGERAEPSQSGGALATTTPRQGTRLVVVVENLGLDERDDEDARARHRRARDPARHEIGQIVGKAGHVRGDGADHQDDERELGAIEEVAPHADQGEELRRVCAQTVQESSGDAAVMQRWCSGRGSARQAVLLCGVPRRGSSVRARKRLPMAAHLHTEEVGLEQEALGRCVRGEAEAAEEGCEANGDQEPRPVL